ncbi:MAG: hypothetical protein RMK99_15900, partial [Anaerolineales bacterium]|nr:hypothetical protein [Anaerolineales bacterium]
LAGEATPIGARIFAVADTFDALTSDRPYRRRCSYAEVQQIIAAEAGRQFDPKVVDAFLAVPAEEWQEIRDRVMAEVEQRRRQHAELIRARRPAPRRAEL